MKRLFIISIPLLLICALGYCGYFLGFQRGFQRALMLQNGTFVVSLDSLDRLRVGDTKGGTERIEGMCFASANIIYGDFVFRDGWEGRFVGNSMLGDLRRYRQAYRTNSAEWTPVERSLEKNLAVWK